MKHLNEVKQSHKKMDYPSYFQKSDLAVVGGNLKIGYGLFRFFCPSMTGKSCARIHIGKKSENHECHKVKVIKKK